MTDAQRAFRRAEWAGAATIAVAAVLLVVIPAKAGPLPPGFRTPILAFELARSASEVESLFAAPGSTERALLVHGMDLGNTIDFLFMVAYGSFLALCGAAVARARGARFHVASVLGPLGALFDVCENRELFAITKSLGGDYAAALSRLGTFTWLKWETLAVAIASLAPFLLRSDKTARVVGALAVAGLLLGVLAFVDRTRFAEAFSMTLSLSFVGLLIVVFRAGRAP